MLIVYDSKTGNTERFVKKIGMRSKKIEEGLVVCEKFILLTYTTQFGQVSEKTAKFLEYNSNNMVAVACSGNRNWGSLFGKSAETIAEKYDVPLLLKFELSGTPRDVEKFKQEVELLVHASSKMD